MVVTITISDLKAFRKVYLKAEEQFLKNYDDVIGVGHEMREIDGHAKRHELVIVLLVRKPFPTDRTSYNKQVRPADFQGVPVIAREPRNSHADLSMIDWVKVHQIAETLSSLGRPSP
jgi:hypothetical protein